MARDLRSLLAGLKAELESAERIGKSTVDEIRTEIARVEKMIEDHLPGHHDPETPAAKVAASANERAERYLAALREERKTADGARAKAIDDEIARAERAAKGDADAVETANADPAAEHADAPAARRGARRA